MSTLLAVVHVVIDANELLWVPAEVIQVLHYLNRGREGRGGGVKERGGVKEEGPGSGNSHSHIHAHALHNLHNTAYVYHGCIFIDHLEGNISITQFLIPEVNIGHFTLTMHHTSTQHNTPTPQHVTPPHNTTHPPHNTSRHVTTPSFNTSYSNSFTTNLQSQQILNMSLSQGSHHLTAHHTTTQHITPPHSTSHHLTTHHTTSQHITTPHSTSHHHTAHHTTTQHITTPSQHITTPHSTSQHPHSTSQHPHTSPQHSPVLLIPFLPLDQFVQ